jgi:hypothetical protein
MQQTVMVVVPKSFLRAGLRIESTHLQYAPMLRGSYHDGIVTKMEDIIGKETAISLGTNEPILRWKINQFQLLPTQGQYTFQIPTEYIRSISNGIRAGDRVRIYITSELGESYRLFEHEVTVASVKSSANVEVDSPDVSSLKSKLDGDAEKMYASRFEANGSIEHINLNLSEAEWLELDKLCSTQKARLVIAFSPTSMNSPISDSEQGSDSN